MNDHEGCTGMEVRGAIPDPYELLETFKAQWDAMGLQWHTIYRVSWCPTCHELVWTWLGEPGGIFSFAQGGKDEQTRLAVRFADGSRVKVDNPTAGRIGQLWAAFWAASGGQWSGGEASGNGVHV